MEDYALIDDYAVIDPATGERLATFPQASQADIDTALDAAASACKSWGRASGPAERDVLLCLGIHGQMLYVNVATGVVAANRPAGPSRSTPGSSSRP